MKKLLFQGSESRIYVQDYLGKEVIVKERFEKRYRHPDLDSLLTKKRIRSECRNILRCKQFGIKTPAIYHVDLNKRLIYLEYFKLSKTVKEYLQSLEGNETTENIIWIADLIGESIAKMHSHNLVHGDLTTSNFLLVENKETEKTELVVIDFGLSHLPASDEDKGVDLYVLERAISSTHVYFTDFFKHILEKYKSFYGQNVDKVIKKFEEVRARGRKRCMVG